MICLVLGYVLSQFYRAFLAVLTPALEADLGATSGDLAFASGLWFLTFAIMQIPVGEALDRIEGEADGRVIHTVANPLHHRGSDKCRRQRRTIDPDNREISFERVDLTPIPVAANINVNRAETQLIGMAVRNCAGQQDHPSTGAKRRHPVGQPFRQQLVQLEGLQQLDHCRRLATRNDQRIATLKLSSGANL